MKRRRLRSPGFDLRWPLPCWCAAGLTAVVAGAVSGSMIGTTPIVDRAGDEANPYYPAPAAPHDAVPAFADARPTEPLPDHYPLVTPRGTIPVAALASHGRLRYFREGRLDEPATRPRDLAYPDQLDEAEIDRLAEWTPPSRRAIAPNASAPPPQRRETRGPVRLRQAAADQQTPLAIGAHPGEATRQTEALGRLPGGH